MTASSVVARHAIECAAAASADTASALVHRIDRHTLETLPALGWRESRWQGFEIRLTVGWGGSSVELFLDDPRKAAMARELRAARSLVLASPARRAPSAHGAVTEPRPLAPPTTRADLGAVLRDLEAASRAGAATLHLQGHTEQRAVALQTMQGFAGAYAQARSAVDVVARSPGGPDVVRRLWDIDQPEEARRRWIETVIDESRRSAHAKPLRAMRADVVLSPRVVGELMHLAADAAVLPHLRGAGTFLSGRRGKKVASRHVSLIDRALRGNTSRCRPFDDEGVRTRTLRIIDDGVFEDVLTNRYFATHYRERPSGSFTRPFRLPGVIGATNLVLEPGTVARGELLHSARLVITDLMGFAFDLRSGRFGRSASGFTLRRGALHEAVSGFLFVGSLPELLRGVVAVGDDATDTATGVFPSVLVQDAEIAG